MNIQKIKKNKAIVSMLILVLMVLSTLLPNFSFAESKTQKVTIKKVKYNKNDSEFPGSVNAFQTSGRAFNKIPNYMSAYDTNDTKEYGKVVFAIYRLSSDGNAQVKDGVPSNELKTDLAKKGTASTYLGAKVTEAQVLGNDGLATLTVGTLDSAAPQNFAILETTPAKNTEGKLIVQKAAPMVLSLPHFDSKGANFDLKLVAKNEVSKTEMEIKMIDEDKAVVPETAFELYKGELNAPATFNNSTLKLVTNLNANQKGMLTLKDLTQGRYYLVEKESKYVRDPFNGTNKDNKRYLLSDKILKNSDNKYFFDVTNDGITIPAGSLIGKEGSTYIINHFATPIAVKKVLDTALLEPGKSPKFQVSVIIPGNIEDYEYFKVRDTRTEATLSKPTKLENKHGLTITQEEGQDGKVYFVFKIDEALKRVKGQEVKFTYEMKINETTTSSTPVSNKITPIFKPSTKQETNDPVVPGEDPKDKGTKTGEDNPIKDPINPKDGSDTLPEDPDNPGKVLPPKDEVTPGSGDDTGGDKGGGTVTIKLYKLFVNSYHKGLTNAGKEVLEGVTFKLKNAEGKYYKSAGVWDATGTALTTKGKNQLVFDGLKNGTYTVEIVSVPSGYNKPLDLTITKTMKDADLTIDIDLSATATLPLTGSEQLVVLAIMGIAIIATAVAVLRKKENK